MTCLFAGTRDLRAKVVEGLGTDQVTFSYASMQYTDRAKVIKLIALGLIVGRLALTLAHANVIGTRMAWVVAAGGYGGAAALAIAGTFDYLSFIRSVGKLSPERFQNSAQYVDTDGEGFCEAHGYKNKDTEVDGKFWRDSIYGLLYRVPSGKTHRYHVVFCKYMKRRTSILEGVRQRYAYGPPRVFGSQLEMMHTGFRQMADSMRKMGRVSVQCHMMEDKQRLQFFALFVAGVLMGSIGVASLQTSNLPIIGWTLIAGGYGTAILVAVLPTLIYLSLLYTISNFYAKHLAQNEDLLDQAQFAHPDHPERDGTFTFQDSMYFYRYNTQLTGEGDGWRVEVHPTKKVHDEHVAAVQAQWKKLKKSAT